MRALAIGLLLLLAWPAVATTPAPAPAGKLPVCAADNDRKRHWPPAIRQEQDRLSQLAAPAGGAEAELLASQLRASAEFGSERWYPQLHWQWRLQRDGEKPAPAKSAGWLQTVGEWLHDLARLFGTLSHVVLWLLLLVLLLVLWRQGRRWRWRRAATAMSTRIAGIDIAPLLAPDALPDDVVAGSEHLWRAGHAREALSLLYRAALHRLGMQLDFAIPESATENECLRLIGRRADADTTAAFRQLLNAWLAQAWEHRDIAAADFPLLVAAYRRVSEQPALTASPAPRGAPA